ncbi:hypothetical protein ACPA5B_03455 [Pseudomonas solani]|uniref:hypothetical protein n=1 Tax=Pseudomonas solani TaxID=2731552 RepID=UPI003C2B66BF
MKQRPRIYYTENQKAVMWEHWKRGDSLRQVAQLFVVLVKVTGKDTETVVNALIKSARKMNRPSFC